MRAWTRARGYWELFENWRRGARRFAREHCRTMQQRLESVTPILGPIEEKRVLDIGCGQRCPFTLMFAACGAEAVGIDLVPGDPGRPALQNFIRNLRQASLELSLRSLVRQVLFDPIYFGELESCMGRRLPLGAIEVKRMSAEGLRFLDSSFDLVSSDQVWEHIADVDRATSEVARVLRPGGLVSMTIALFPSLSGGHHFTWAEPDEHASSYVPPWDHLRDNRYPSTDYLNRYSAEAFRSVFEKHLRIIEWDTSQRVGRKHLTPRIRGQLQAYTEEELLTPNVVVLAARP